VKVTLCQHAPRLSALLSLITYQSLVVSLSSIVQKRVFMLYIYNNFHVVYIQQLAHKGLIAIRSLIEVLVVSISNIVQKRVFMLYIYNNWHMKD